MGTGKVVQTMPLPGASGGIAMDRSAPLAYVSGVADSDAHADQQTPAARPAARATSSTSSATHAQPAARRFQRLIPVPPPVGRAAAAELPADRHEEGRVARPARDLPRRRDAARAAEPRRLRPRSSTSRRGAVRYVDDRQLPLRRGDPAGRQDRPGLQRGAGTVSVIDLAAGTKLKRHPARPHLSHPEAIAIDPSGARAYVAVANADQVAVLDIARRARWSRHTLCRPRARRRAIGTSPVALDLTPRRRPAAASRSRRRRTS